MADIKDRVRALHRANLAGELDDNGIHMGDTYVVEGEGRYRVNSKTYVVTGDKRLTVKEEMTKAPKATAPAKPRAKREALPDQIEVTCRISGKKFKVSKFTPYLDVHPDVRAKLVKEGKHIDPQDDIEQVCEVTGKKFKVSKYNPYITVSPEGRKILRQRAKEEAAATNK